MHHGAGHARRLLWLSIRPLLAMYWASFDTNVQATRADFYGWQRVDFALQETAFQSGLVA